MVFILIIKPSAYIINISSHIPDNDPGIVSQTLDAVVSVYDMFSWPQNMTAQVVYRVRAMWQDVKTGESRIT